ncbi:DNA cytosine methyltransferase [Picosynechococcus sp. PCC 73109]|uniref:DNA cytosine methyltransferase n=1 Tax=Picosynechococcus sp. PCC 73109 TaxID=374982 RepID=UPI0007459208|nr:DNA cytosine methyltransferase [Picosynechococcus sp. PCC 73109]AMA08620.1 DNA (cytosine-5-)-methyltransferase [Picosynechococcus sp. PCC 73109]
MNQRPLAIDLFAGCGGMSLGLEAAGFDVVAAVEIDPVHALVHEVNFPYGVTFCRDIRHLQWPEMRQAIERRGYPTVDIDLLTGGPPCQGFSVMGKRQLGDPRNQLIFEYVRLLRDIQPKYFIFENVQGLTGQRHQGMLKQLCQSLGEAGYHVLPPQVLNGADYGAPQRRKRLILLGYRRDVPPVAYPTPSHGPGLTPYVTVHEAITDLETIPVFTDVDRGIIPPEPLGTFGRSLHEQFRHCHSRHLEPNFLWGHLGSQHQPEIQARFQATPPGKKEAISRLFKLDAQGLSNTLRAGTPTEKGSFTAPRPIHYQLPRCISIREAARLHTFPDWFQFHRKVWHGFREIGNAVLPLLAQKIAQEIIHTLDIQPDLLPQKTICITQTDALWYPLGQASQYWEIPRHLVPRRRRLSPP